jgi:nicotinate dehydrogenase subunit B
MRPRDSRGTGEGIRLTVNGRPVTVADHPDTPLLYVLRNTLGLRGTRFGCGLGQCGACNVRLDGRVVPSCDTPLWSAEGRSVITVEGLGSQGAPHPVQQALLDEQAGQCGFCLSGIAVRAAALLEEDPHPTEERVAEALARNLCRCGSHQRIVRAVVRAGRTAAGTGPGAGGEPATAEHAGAATGTAGAPTGTPPAAAAGTGGRPATADRADGQPAATTRAGTGRTVGAGSAPPDVPRDVAANPRLSRWLTVSRDGTVHLRVGKVELGQGILTALAQVAADELGVPLAQVRPLPAHTDLGPDEGLTAGSMSIPHAVPAVRLAAATARARFVVEAARRWGVPAAEVTVEDGVIRHPAVAQATSYGELAADVDLDVDIDPTVPLANPPRLVGTSAARLDLPDTVAGRPRFIADLRLPGMRFGRVVRPPSPGARLEAVGEPGTDGVVVVRDGSFLGVVGDDEFRVVQAAQRLAATSRWSERDQLPDESDLAGFLRRGPHARIQVLEEGGDAPDAASAVRRLRASYSRPYLAHASLGTSCGVACWEPDGRLRVWSHSQGIFQLRDALAKALGIEPTRISIEHVPNAGCYGHNGADDAAFDAVLLARAVPGVPVLVQWSRQDELTWSPVGSAMLAEVEATVDTTGRITSWSYDVYSHGHTSRPGYAGVPGLLAGAYLERPLDAPPAADPPPAAGGGATRNAVPIYTIGARRITAHLKREAPIRTSALRSLGAYLNVFAIESFMDELAAACGEDPVAYRLRHLDDERARAVLERAAEAAGWGAPLPDGHGRGVGLARYKNSGAYCAVVAHAEATDRVRVHRLTVAVDVGQVVNPDGVRNQMEGGAVQAASWTLTERVRFDRRRLTSRDWESYPILRFGQTPAVDVHLIDRPDAPPVGAGEAAAGPTAAAIGNAVAAALGVRVRHLPITTDAVVAAIEATDT